jgi:hypothetical protein
MWTRGHLAWPFCRLNATATGLSISLAIDVGVGRRLELDRSAIRSVRPSAYHPCGLRLVHGMPDLPPALHLSTFRPGRLASRLEALGYPLSCRPARFARQGAGFVLTTIAVTLLVVRFAVDAMLDLISAQLHFEDVAHQVVSIVTAGGVITLCIGLMLLAWAYLSE